MSQAGWAELAIFLCVGATPARLDLNLKVTLSIQILGRAAVKTGLHGQGIYWGKHLWRKKGGARVGKENLFRA